MNAIVVVDKKWGIGKNNDLLFKLPEDMKYFRQKTLNKIVVMGSNTLKSFPDGKPLKNRTNAVLFPGGEKRDDCIVADSLEELRQVLTSFPEDDIFIIGGAMMYKTMLPFCKRVYVTKVDADGQASVFFPDLDRLGWTLSERVAKNATESTSWSLWFIPIRRRKNFDKTDISPQRG